jgi:hypothetical protein
MASPKHPIIAHGELYATPITKRSGGGSKQIPHPYEEAKHKIIADIDRISKGIQEKQEVFLEEKIVCVRMEPKFEAKSYVPTQLTTDSGMSIVGGRKYGYTNDAKEHGTESEAAESEAKLYFIKTDNKGISKLRETLATGIKDRVDTWRNQIGSIHSIDLLKSEEKIMGFPDGWTSGTVEIVLHPLESEHKKMLDLFFSISKIPEKNTRVKTYKDGLTFISAKCSSAELENIKRFNPLRAIHPLGRLDLTPVRLAPGGSAPILLPSNKKSSIIVGVFDGGVVNGLPLLNGYVTATDCAATTSDQDYLSHGTAVCGTVLHGNLAGKSKSDTLPSPCVSIESYRVFPLLNKDDLELYEIIDEIENIVHSRPAIKLYNLSFGPIGAIIDDSINRFTYVLDQLTYEVHKNEPNPLFCVAVGNDGELIEPFNRIQSPSDIVNGLGIGAYTYRVDGSKARAQYSCIGSGREGAKVKPDFLDFGGSPDRPFGLVGLDPNSLAMGQGTSFASPYAANKIGKLMAKSENIVPHLGRALLIHNALFDEKLPRNEQGYGFCPEVIDDILLCEDRKVVIMYSGSLKPAQTVSLPIFAPNINNVKGLVNISWTIATIVAPYPNDPDAYTNDCISDVFIPHDETFSFYKEDPITQESDRKILNLCESSAMEEAERLLVEGYTKSELPVSHSARHFCSESDLRAKDLKWDTVIKKQVSMRGSSLRNPVLTLQAIDRNDFNAPHIKYHVVVSIEAPNYAGSLYDAILQSYKSLVPIELRDINRIMVDVNHP